MRNGRSRWMFFKTVGMVFGLIAAAFWSSVSLILALGIVGLVEAVYLFPLVLATLGLFLVFSFLWQTSALVRVGVLLERIEGLLGEGASGEEVRSHVDRRQ